MEAVACLSAAGSPLAGELQSGKEWRSVEASPLRSGWQLAWQLVSPLA